MAVATPCAVSVRLSALLSARAPGHTAAFPRRAHLTRRPRSLVVASASQLEKKDKDKPSGDVGIQHGNQNTNEKGAAVQRRPRRVPTLDISPFGLVDSLSPMRAMRQMLDALDRVFEEAMSFPGTVGEIRVPWDVEEDEEELRIRVDVPGLSREEVRVWVEDGVLVIKGEHKEEEEGDGGGQGEGEGGGWKELGATAYETRLLLPEECDAERVRAELRNGVLLVTVPKRKVERNIIDVEVK